MSMHQPVDPNPITQLIDDLKEVMSEIDTEANARAEGDLAVKDWCAQLIEKALDKAVAQLEQKIDSADEKAELTTRALVKDEVKKALGKSLPPAVAEIVQAIKDAEGKRRRDVMKWVMGMILGGISIAGTTAAIVMWAVGGT